MGRTWVHISTQPSPLSVLKPQQSMTFPFAAPPPLPATTPSAPQASEMEWEANGAGGPATVVKQEQQGVVVTGAGHVSPSDAAAAAAAIEGAAPARCVEQRTPKAQTAASMQAWDCKAAIAAEQDEVAVWVKANGKGLPTCVAMLIQRTLKSLSRRLCRVGEGRGTAVAQGKGIFFSGQWPGGWPCSVGPVSGGGAGRAGEKQCWVMVPNELLLQTLDVIFCCSRCV